MSFSHEVSSDGVEAAAQAGMGTLPRPRFTPGAFIGFANAEGTSAYPDSALRAEFQNSWFLSGVEFLVLIVWSVVTGVLYHRLALQETGVISRFLATGILIAIILCGSERIFRPRTRVIARRQLQPLVQTTIIWCSSFLLLTFLAFSFRVSLGLSRGAVLVFFFTGLPLLLLARRGATGLFAKHLYSNSQRWNDAVIIGGSQRAINDAVRSFHARGCVNPSVVTIDTSCSQPLWPSELERALKQATSYAHKAGPGAVYVCAQDLPSDRFQMLLAGLQIIPRTVRIIPDAMTSHLLSFPLRNDLDGLSVEVQCSPLTVMERVIKRVFDLTMATVLAIFFLPVFLVIATAIKLDSKGPIFFRQTRLGYRGRAFKIIKFRTMTVLENGGDIAQVKKNDHRVTRVGRFLRRTSLDELPQLLNVIHGTMSLVGPRPHAEAHDKLYARLMPNYELRQHVRPGITGWAQVHGLRGETATTDLMWRRVELDIWYAKNASLMLDAEILLRTGAVIFGQENAY